MATERRRSKKKQRKRKASSAASARTSWIRLDFRGPKRRSTRITSSEKLQQFAMRWRFKLTKRGRWRRADETRRQLANLEDELGRIRGANRLRTWVGSTDFVEVAIPYTGESEGWEGRIAPWEFILSMVSRVGGRTGDFTVVRHLKRDGSSRKKVKPREIERVLYVQAAPDELDRYYTYERERRLLQERFGGADLHKLINPTLAELRNKVKELKPDLVHVAGVDNRQARRFLENDGLLPGSWPADETDGLVLTGEDGEMAPTPAWEIAQALNAGASSPEMVFVNVYHSASRICALAVAEGARYAIGFQDTIDDELAEILCSEFYAGWRACSWRVLPAFVDSIRRLRSAPRKLVGTGVVLWSDHSILDDQYGRLPEDTESWNARRRAAVEHEAGEYDWLETDIVPHTRINYSLMHNDARGLFSSFSFRKFKEGTLHNVSVRVELHVGAESFAFRKCLDLKDTFTPIEGDIRVPLTADLIRTAQEPMRTSVFYEVAHAGHVLHRNTERVTLLPVDEWVDTDENRLWLPSFVLPRDPCIEKIISGAHNHLMTLADDRKCGFSGYQGTDADDPESLEPVDNQVRAIWTALVHQFGVRYINPPPSYSEYGQRLRTPSQVLRGRQGTCIDLALLLAACLEHVDIYPVIFLFEGHAFCGYWRHEDYYWDFTLADDEENRDSMAASTGTVTADRAWIIPKRELSDVHRLIMSDRIYPVETVGLTDHGSFWRSIDEGVEYFDEDGEHFDELPDFHSLVDIRSAREHDVTPLPIKEDES